MDAYERKKKRGGMREREKKERERELIKWQKRKKAG